GAKSAEAALAAEQKAVEADSRALTAESAARQTSLVTLAEQRAGLAHDIDPALLSTYDTLARRRNGIAVAEARDGVCTICHVRLRPQVFNTVRRNDSITQCDSCHRVLYFVPPPKPEPEKPEHADKTEKSIVDSQ